MKKIISLITASVMTALLTLSSAVYADGEMPKADTSGMVDITANTKYSPCYVIRNGVYTETNAIYDNYSKQVLKIDGDVNPLTEYVYTFTGFIPKGQNGSESQGKMSIHIGGTVDDDEWYILSGQKITIEITATNITCNGTTQAHGMEILDDFEGYISYIDGVFVYGIKPLDADDSEYIWGTFENDELAGRIRTDRFKVEQNAAATKYVFKPVSMHVFLPETKAEIDGEQIAREGTEITAVLSADGGLPVPYTITANAPDTISITDGTDSYDCTARAEADKVIFTLPEQLDFSTEYDVDLSSVTAIYTVNDVEYESNVSDTSFLTNNGEKELALNAANLADTEADMVTALEAFNAFNDESTRVEFFTDVYFTNAADDSEKLASRKQSLAKKVIAYREANGDFLKMDFSELIAAVEEGAYELKMESYTKPDEATEDMLEIFTDTAFYNTDDKKSVSAALITELMDGTVCETTDELKALEKKAKSVMAVSLAENDDIITIFDDTENYDFADIIDITSEVIENEDGEAEETNKDYISNKSTISKKMTELRADDFTYYTIAELKKDFEIAKGISAINGAETRLDAAEAIEKYGEALGLNLTEYKTKDANLVCIALVGKSFADVDEIQKTIDARIKELDKEEEEEEKKNNRKPSGGGGGGGSVIIAPSVPVTTPQPTKAPASSSENPFKDLDSVDWAREAIVSLYKQGKVNGVSEGKFEPNRNITRAEFAKLVSGAFNIAADSDVSFADVNANDWYNSSVMAVASAGLVKGNSSNEFMPNASLTRQDMATIIYRLIEHLGKADILSKDGNAESLGDYSSISDYAVEAVGKLYANGIVNGTGDNSFAPLKSTTRAEATVLLYRIMQK